MSTVSVDIDLDDVGLDNLAESFDRKLDRISESRAQRDISKERAQRICNNLLDKVLDCPVFDNEEHFEVNNIKDQIKLEHLMKVYKSYTLEEIESKLPEK